MIEDIRYYLNYELPEIIKYNLNLFLDNIDNSIGIFPLILIVAFVSYILYSTKNKHIQNSIFKSQNIFFEDLGRIDNLEEVEEYILSYKDEIGAKYAAFYEKRGNSFLLLNKDTTDDEQTIFVPLKLKDSTRKRDKPTGRYRVYNYISNNQKFLLRFYTLKTIDLNEYAGFIEMILQYYNVLKKADTTNIDQQIQNHSKIISEHIHGAQLGHDSFLKFMLSLIIKVSKVDGVRIYSDTKEIKLGTIVDKDDVKKLFYIRNTPYKLEVYGKDKLSSKQISSIGAFLELSGTLLLTLTEDSKIIDTYLNFLQSTTINIEDENIFYKNHSKKVSIVASQVSKKLFLGQDKIKNIEMAASIHDIGMAGDISTLINSKDILQDDDFDIIKYHPIIGEIIVHPISSKYPISVIIKYHHERYDGNGYPYGLVGNDIPIEAQILAFAETFIGMIGDREYKKGLSFEEAQEEVKKMSSKAFGATIIDAFNEASQSIQQRLQRLNFESQPTI